MNETLAALAEPNRLHIVELLREQPCTVGTLVQRLELPQPLVSKHLRVLRQARVVRVQVRAQRRIYALEPAPFQELNSWIGSFRRIWEGRLDSLDQYLQHARKQGK